MNDIPSSIGTLSHDNGMVQIEPDGKISVVVDFKDLKKFEAAMGDEDYLARAETTLGDLIDTIIRDVYGPGAPELVALAAVLEAEAAKLRAAI